MAADDFIRPISCRALIDADEIGAREFVRFITDIENSGRRAAVAAVTLVAKDQKIPELVTDATNYRIWTLDESLFQIAEIGDGSKWLKGVFVLAVVAEVFKLTIGESLSEGWKETKSHQQIVDAVPKIEKYFLDMFEGAFRSRHDRPSPYRYEDRVAITRNEEELSIDIKVRRRQESKKKL